MVFTHILDSVVVSPADADGRKSEEIKRIGPQLSLKELMSPFGLSKGRLNGAHAIRDSSSHRYDQPLISSSQKQSTARVGEPVVIVGPEHNFLRSRECKYSKESLRLHVQKADDTKPEYSDSRSHGLRETPPANESHRDSSSEIQTAPFSKESHFLLPRKEATGANLSGTIKPQTTIYNYSYTQTPSMSSPKCYKQLSRRSRSIAIKCPQPLGHGVMVEDDSASNERMYDWATWRMYNRIVDHRRNQRLPSPSMPQPGVYTTSNATTIPHAAIDDYDHGEVFEMEI